MSAVCSAESGDLNSALREKDLKQNGSLRITNTAKQSSERTFQIPLFTETYENSILENSKKLIYSQVASPARTSPVPTQKEKELKENGAGYGHITQKLLGRYNQNTQSLKTFQCSLTEDSTLSLETLPKTGMMQNGSVYGLQISERYTEENDYSLLPTLQAREWKGMTAADYKTLRGEKSKWGRGSLKSAFLPTVTGDSVNMRTKNYAQGGTPLPLVLLPTLTINGNYNRKGASKTSGDGLVTVLKRVSLPTISATEYKGAQKNRYKGSRDFRGVRMSEGLRTCKEDPIYLNPSFAEVMMGFPVGWTELSVVETQSFRKLHNSSQGELKR